jgi:hypothetical protein
MFTVYYYQFADKNSPNARIVGSISRAGPGHMQKAPPRVGRGFAKSARTTCRLLLDEALGQLHRLTVLAAAA